MQRTTLPRRGGRSPTSGTGQTTVPSVRRTWLAIAVGALLIAVVGTALQVRAQRAAEAVPLDRGTVGGITASTYDAGWVAMDHSMNDQGGYQMPAQMMPGAPEGDDMRLGVPLTLLNTGDESRQFILPEEFSLLGGRNDQPRLLHSDTLGQLSRLGPGSAVNGVLYFDTIVPGSGDAPLYLRWQRDGRTVRLAIRLGGDVPDHGDH
jgi:hypothetical protein